MVKARIEDARLHALLHQALAAVLGGIEVYHAAITCAVSKDLRKEWQNCLDVTRTHKDMLIGVFAQLELDAEQMTPGRIAAMRMAASLVEAIRSAKDSADATAAQLVAAECVMLAEAQTLMNWELIGSLARYGRSAQSAALQEVRRTMEEREGQRYLFHTRDWVRELWLDSLGFASLLPPPAALKHMESAEHARLDQRRERTFAQAHWV